MPAPRAALIDIDGVLTVSWHALPGAADALGRLRRAGLGLAFLTNTTGRTRASIAAALDDAGLPVTPAEILTAPAAAAAHLRSAHPGARCALVNSGDVREDLGDVTIVPLEERPEVIVLGGAGPEFDYESINRVFQWAVEGVPIVAMHRNLYWRTDEGWQLDTGAYLHAIETAANVPVTVVGKPSPAFFDAALAQVGVRADHAVMVGDDVETDVLAAQGQGIEGVLVRTGKFREQALRDASAAPDHVVDSFADVPELLGL